MMFEALPVELTSQILEQLDDGDLNNFSISCAKIPQYNITMRDLTNAIWRKKAVQKFPEMVETECQEWRRLYIFMDRLNRMLNLSFNTRNHIFNPVTGNIIKLVYLFRDLCRLLPESIIDRVVEFEARNVFYDDALTLAMHEVCFPFKEMPVFMRSHIEIDIKIIGRFTEQTFGDWAHKHFKSKCEYFCPKEIHLPKEVEIATFAH